MRKALLFLLILSFQLQSQELLLHYKFDNNVNDSSGNNYTGTSSGVTFVADRNGNSNSAVSFDGINDFIDFPNISQLKPNLPVSFSFWIKYESNNVQDRVVFNTSFKEDVNSGVYLTTQSSTGKLAVGFGDGSSSFTSTNRRGYLSNNVIQSNEWHQIHIVIISSTNMKVYLDCVETGGNYSGSGSGLNYSSNPGSLGRHDQNPSSVASYYFKGVLDDFKYYKGIIVPTLNTTTFTGLRNEVCIGASYSLPTTSSNGITGNWSPAFNSSSLGSKIYTFIPNPGQCSSRFNQTIEVVNELTATFTNLETNLCKNNSYSLPTTSSNGITGVWSPAFDSSTIGTTSYTFTPNAGQCAASFTHSIEITNEITPSFISLETILCEGNTYSLPTTSFNGVSGTWSPAFDSSTIGTTSYTFTPNAGQCAASFTHSIEITDKITPSFISLETILCEGSTYSLPATSFNGVSGTWSPLFDSSTIGTTSYTFTPNSDQCGTNFTHSIEVNKKEIPLFSMLPKLIFKNENYDLPKVSDNGVIGTWSPFFDSSVIGEHTYTFTPNNIDCSNNFIHKIIVSNELVIPIYFTPNNDGTYDFWKILGLDNFTETKLSIFDRYGKLLSELDVNIGWNGKYKGKNMPTNDYWYRLSGVNPSNEIIVKNGHFSLLRK